MRVHVRYMAQLKQAAGTASESVELDGPWSALAFVAHLAERHGEPLRQFLLGPEGQLRPSVLVFVGDEQVVAGQSVPLRDGDVLTLLTPIAGG